MNSLSRHLPWCVCERRLLATPALLLGFVALAAGQAAQEPAPIFTAARTAAVNKDVIKTKLLGFSSSKKAFDELPAIGAVLIGFDVGLEKQGKDVEIVAALRPIYRTASGETYFNDYGLFYTRGAGKDMLKTRVTRIVRLSASSGYAVGSITMRTGVGIDGMSIRFLRINGRMLDMNEVYDSDWVGSQKGGREAHIGDGSPIIGVFGNQNDVRVVALGLYTMKNTPTPLPVPVDPPRPETAKKPPVETKPEAVRPTEPTDTVKQSQTGLPSGSPVETDDDEAGQLPAWMLLGLLVMVLIPGIVGLVVIFGRKPTSPAQKTVVVEEEQEKPQFDLDDLRGLAGLSPMASENANRPRRPKPSEANRPDASKPAHPQRGDEQRDE